MQAMQMKIVHFDALSGAISIKFAGDKAEKPIDEYPAHEFNIVETHNNVKVEDILKALAQNGWNIAFQQEASEEIARNDVKIGVYKNLVGNKFSYTQEELFAPEACIAEDNQPATQGLIII